MYKAVHVPCILQDFFMMCYIYKIIYQKQHLSPKQDRIKLVAVWVWLTLFEWRLYRKSNGCPAWTRTKIPSSRGMCPTIRRPGNYRFVKILYQTCSRSINPNTTGTKSIFC